MRNKGAEICEKYLNKGDKVYIEGRLKTRKWQDDKGNDRYSTEIICNDFTFLNKISNNFTNDEIIGAEQKTSENDTEITNDLPF